MIVLSNFGAPGFVHLP